MYRRKRISVCIPARNEGSHLAAVIANIPSFVDEIIVVSNCSTDDTVKVAKKLGVKVYEDDRTENNIGYGYAHITGTQKATGDIVVGIDADGTYPIENLAKVIDYMDKKKLDFVSCNRYPILKGTATIPLKIRIGMTLLNWEVQLLYRTGIKDILSGMWAFKPSALPHLELTAGDWNLSMQIKVSAALNKKIKYGEYPIVQHNRHGKSHMKYFRVGWSYAMWALKNRPNKAYYQNK